MALGRVHTDIQDNGLVEAQAADKITVCSQEPTDYTEANVTYNLGEITGLTSGDFPLADGDSSSGRGARKVTVGVQVGTALATGQATWVAWLDTAGSRLLYACPMPDLELEIGQPFVLPAHKLEKQAPLA